MQVSERFQVLFDFFFAEFGWFSFFLNQNFPEDEYDESRRGRKAGLLDEFLYLVVERFRDGDGGVLHDL